MSRPSRVRRLALVALLAAAGCQDYNFNPVGHCVVQPGSARVKLSDISTADVLFVVDDSGSMGGEQTNLAQSFQTFITNLDTFNKQRATNGQTPIDFHVAITTTSVFLNNPSTAYCKADCPGASGAGDVCCRTSGSTLIGPLKQAQRCSGAADTATCATGNTCTDACTGYLGEFVCCTAANAPQKTANVPCETLDEACGDLQTHYQVDPSCAAGNAVNGEYYPHGAFVGQGGNPRVLHFDKSLYPLPTDPACPAGGCTNRQGFTAGDLMAFFQENVVAGTCGSGQEQGLQASQLAVAKAVASEQVDTYPADSGTAASSLAEWLHPSSKLVLVWVGDEDDCSSPESATRGVIITGNPGSDSCIADQSLPADQQKETQLSDFVSYFSRLTLPDGSLRPLGAAFVVSATPNDCQDASCVPAICIDPSCTETPDMCGGQAPGTRFLSLASQFRLAGADVVEGSICSSFGATLDRIADIVKPPSGLTLPTEPATGEITLLRIVGANGNTRKTCYGPAPAGTPLDANGSALDAKGNPYDWWFTAGRSQETDAEKAPSASTRYVYINHYTQACEASPGETYSADYLGRLPQGGCFGATPKEADDACVAALGGRGYSDTGPGGDGDWTCYAGVDASGVCLQPTAANPGTCICGQRGALTATPAAPVEGNCPVGSAF